MPGASKLPRFLLKNKVLILGGYGNFGKRIAAALVSKGVTVLIAGRDVQKARQLAGELGPLASEIQIDVRTNLSDALSTAKPDVIINTVGPFQGQGYEVARAAIAHRTHYVDLADGREFVTGITKLNTMAKENGIAVIAGASTVPVLPDAVLAEFQDEFEQISKMRYGISPGQGSERGLATTQGILSYVGKPLARFSSIHPKIYGWQDIYRQHYPGLGLRWMANCEVPDLDLLPPRYQIGTIQFSAGLELRSLHLGLWGLSHLVRLGVPLALPKLAKPLLVASNWFNRFGSQDGGMHVILSGVDADHPKQQMERSWYIIARDGDGPHIPTVPAIILADRIAKGKTPPVGAYPCLGMISLSEYLAELRGLKVNTVTSCQSA
jgi:hypothetical protein